MKIARKYRKKLPVTKDGVRVVPFVDKVYYRTKAGRALVMNVWCSAHWACRFIDDGIYRKVMPISQCFSSPQAASAGV